MEKEVRSALTADKRRVRAVMATIVFCKKGGGIPPLFKEK